MPVQRRYQDHLVTCIGGLSLDGLISRQAFQLRVRNNVTSQYRAGRCNVKIQNMISGATVIDINTEFTGNTSAIICPGIYQLDAGVYSINAFYYDTITKLAYDCYYLLFTVVAA